MSHARSRGREGSRKPGRRRADRRGERYLRPGLEWLEDRVVLSAAGDDYLARLYADLLGRTPDAPGMAHWGGLLDQGIPRSEVALGFLNSPEYHSWAVGQSYGEFLGRPADAPGMFAFTALLQSGISLEQVWAGMLGSPEYRERAGGTHEDFLASLYRDVFGRPIDPSGAASWGAALADGRTGEWVAQGVLASPERREALVEGWYEHHLHRPPDDPGLTGWVGLFPDFVTPLQAQALFLASDEYWVGPAGDLDGVPDEVEAGAPNGGDGNADGTPDSRQANVASLPALGGGYATLATPAGTLLAGVRAIENPSPADAPDGVVFPVGFFDFTVLGVAPGGATTVTLTLPEDVSVETYYKYGPTPDNPAPHWYEFLFDGTTGAEILDGRVRLHFADGLRGDDDLTADGVIVDAGGPARAIRPGQFAFGSAAYSVSEDGGQAVITVVRSGGSEGEARVAFATGDGSASGGTDYTPASGVLTFAPGQTERTFSVPVLLDDEAEPTETVNLTLSAPTGGATLGGQRTAALRILDVDRQAPVVEILGPAPGLLTRENVTLTGRASDAGSGVSGVEVRVDSGPFVEVPLDGAGEFRFTTGLALDGSAEGGHVLRVRAEDGQGNASAPVEYAFTLDTLAPAAPAFGLAPASDTDPAGDGVTTLAAVTLEGQTEAGTTAVLDETGASTTANASGRFTFAGVPLALGPNPFTVRARDGAGNESTAGVTLTRVPADGDPPVIDAALANDTGVSDSDGLTSDPAVAGTVSDAGTVTSFRAGLDDALSPDFVDLLADLGPGGAFALDAARLEAVNGGPLAEGPHTLRLVAGDDAGNVSTVFEVVFTLDTVAPAVTATSPVQGALLEPEVGADIPVEVAFGEPMDGPSVLAALTVTGDVTGEILPLGPTYDEATDTLRFDLGAGLPDGAVTVTVGDGAKDVAGNPLTGGAFTLDFTVNRAFVLTEISPAQGEELVSTTRSVVVHFSLPIDPATVTPESVQVIANGTPVAGRLVVSSSGKRATFFPDDPWPGSTEVRVRVDGDRIRSTEGDKLDADGDRVAGGVATADFRTVPMTRIAGTNVTGRVIASERGPGGEDVPLGGVTIRVDGFEDFVAVTDEEGFFTLVDTPAPVFFVHIDGSTTTTVGGEPVPAGGFYPNVGKQFHSVPGQTVPLSHHGDAFDIHLPFILNEAIHPITPGEPLTVTLPASQTQNDPAMARVSVTIPANSLIHEDGTPGSQVGIYRVDSDRLPAPLPDGLNHIFDITVQADAPIFDEPAPVTFPNLDNLAPGEKTLLMSFDHARSEWVVVGTMTVSADGLTVVSDPGVGIRAPGWHGMQPGSQTAVQVRGVTQSARSSLFQSGIGLLRNSAEAFLNGIALAATIAALSVNS